jgi:predicted heme/steroid binding protein
LLAVSLLLSAAPAQARPEFAQLTGQPCSYCHISPLGGGPRNENGIAFQEGLGKLDVELDPKLRLSSGQKLLHILLWLVHMPFGIGWVGMFFLAFLPAVRTHKLMIPSRQYIRQMIYGMVVIAVSGPTIAYFKAKMIPGLFGTRLGLLLLVKITAVLGLFAATIILIWHTTVLLAKRYRELSGNLESGQEMELDPEDLALFDGSEKRKALVGVDGKLFDVTGRNLWRKGIHPGGHHAGTDLTDAFAEAPHGKEVFERVRPVGRLLSERSAGKRPSPRWAVLLGLAASSIIVLVVVLWRW